MTKLLAKFATYLQTKFPVNRVVVLLTPAFVALSGYAAAWTGEHFPGLPQFTSAQITGFMVAGAAAGLTAAYRWLKGWEAHEAQVAVDPSVAVNKKLAARRAAKVK
jgi:hypothetical protein